MRKFISRLNGAEHTLGYDPAGNQYQFDEESFQAAASAVSPGRYSIVIDGTSVDVRVTPIETSDGEMQYLAQAEGEEFIVEVVNPRQWRRGTGAAQLEGMQRITAPMPGKVVRVLAGEGQAVEAGQGLIVVEAMKMQNEIKSPRTGTARKVSATEGQTVAAGQLLMVIE